MIPWILKLMTVSDSDFDELENPRKIQLSQNPNFLIFYKIFILEVKSQK